MPFSRSPPTQQQQVYLLYVILDSLCTRPAREDGGSLPQRQPLQVPIFPQPPAVGIASFRCLLKFSSGTGYFRRVNAHRHRRSSGRSMLVPADVAEQPCSGIWNARGCAMKSSHLTSKVCNVGRPTETQRLPSKTPLRGSRTPCNKIPSDPGPPWGATPKRSRRKTTTTGGDGAVVGLRNTRVRRDYGEPRMTRSTWQ